MKLKLFALLLLADLVLSLQATAQQQQPPPPQPAVAHTNLKVGDMAPDFTLPDNGGKQVHLADFRGKKNVVLAFYVLAFTSG
jgi:cytochrome oxidase Cu insertion factor (SCO1/SenC/PrrC family)